jgi:hypothetical protein
MATLTFFKYERIIQVDSPQTEVEVQDLLNQIRDYEEQLINLDYGHIANAYGKQSLGGGSYIGITLELINNWRLSFEARTGPDTIPCYVKGGNLVAINDYDNNAIYPTAFTQVNIAQSTSPAIIQADTDYSLLYLVESLRGRHASVGNVYYWDPTGGSDSNVGTTPATAVATFSQAQSLATAGNNDIIFALSTDSSGITTVTEVLTITKANLKVRGSGYSFQLKPASGSDAVTISGNNVEFSGFYIQPTSGGTDNGITVTGDNVLIKDCWVNSASGNGIDVSSTSRTEINTCAIEDCTGYGINVGATTSLSTIRKCIISGNSRGVNISGASITDNILENNVIFNHTSSGIEIDSGVVRTGIRLNHTFAANTPNINDNGTGTFQDTSGTITQGDIDSIVDGVWDEVISSSTHAGAGSAGKTLREAKVKATLASLK